MLIEAPLCLGPALQTHSGPVHSRPRHLSAALTESHFISGLQLELWAPQACGSALKAGYEGVNKWRLEKKAAFSHLNFSVKQKHPFLKPLS